MKEIGVAVFVEGDFVVAIGMVTVTARDERGAASARCFEYLVRSGQDGHWRRTSICELDGKAFCQIAPRSVSDDRAALAWLRGEIEGSLAGAVERRPVTSSIAVREVFSSDWADADRHAKALGADTARGEFDPATGRLEILK